VRSQAGPKSKRSAGFSKPQITLIDTSLHHTYIPALYEAASLLPLNTTAQSIKNSLCLYRPSILRKAGINFLPKTATKLNFKKQKISFQDSSEFYYDYLVLALGSITNFSRIQGLKKYALTFKTLNDALTIRNKISSLLRSASLKEQIRIVIGGAGTCGVELAGELHFCLEKLKKEIGKPEIKIQILLIEGASSILPSFPKAIIKTASGRLKKLGIEILTSTFIKKVSSSRIQLDTKNGRILKFWDFKKRASQKLAEIDYDILIWTGGIKPNPLAEKLPIKKDARSGRLITNPYLQALNQQGRKIENVLVIGDINAFYRPKTGQLLPSTAQTAETQGETAAENLFRLLANLPLIPYNPPGTRFIIPIGSRYAVAQFGKFTFKGIFPWILKQLVELKYFLSLLPWWKAIVKWLRSEAAFLRND
jgi:NADH dehydrogenase